MTPHNIPNFFDRISFKYTLNPLGLEETKEMINFRIKKAGYNAPLPLFLDDAVADIHAFAKGYPRKITMICHKALKALLMRNKLAVDRDVVREIINEEVRHGWTLKV